MYNNDFALVIHELGQLIKEYQNDTSKLVSRDKISLSSKLYKQAGKNYISKCVA